MNDFLNKLEKSLRYLNAQEKAEIVADYREHIEIGLEAGKSEQQIIDSLGEPKELAKMYNALGATQRAHESKGVKDTWQMLGAIVRYKVGVGILMASLYFTALSAMFALFATAIGIFAGGGAGLFLAVMLFIKGHAAYGILAVFTSIALISGGLLGVIALIKLWKKSVGNLSIVAQKIMQRKRVTENELDIGKG